MTVEGAIDRYADMVYRLALSQMKNQADAEDLFQEVFVRLVKHMDKMKSWEHVKAWLLKVTVNCARKHFDGAWHRKVTFLHDLGAVLNNARHIRTERCQRADSGRRLVLCVFFKHTPEPYKRQYHTRRFKIQVVYIFVHELVVALYVRHNDN